MFAFNFLQFLIFLDDCQDAIKLFMKAFLSLSSSSSSLELYYCLEAEAAAAKD
jgi:hypothetical protein